MVRSKANALRKSRSWPQPRIIRASGERGSTASRLPRSGQRLPPLQSQADQPFRDIRLIGPLVPCLLPVGRQIVQLGPGPIGIDQQFPVPVADGDPSGSGVGRTLVRFAYWRRRAAQGTLAWRLLGFSALAQGGRALPHPKLRDDQKNAGPSPPANRSQTDLCERSAWYTWQAEKRTAPANRFRSALALGHPQTSAPNRRRRIGYVPQNVR